MPDFVLGKPLEMRPDWSRHPTGMDALGGDAPFIMEPDGRCLLFVPSGLCCWPFTASPIPASTPPRRLPARCTRDGWRSREAAALANDVHAAALRAIDKLLAERPEKVGSDFSSAYSLLVALRDSQVAQWRHSNAEPDRQRLARINSVLSVVNSGHFQQIEKAREVLASLTE
jgi:hypothetical protein